MSNQKNESEDNLKSDNQQLTKAESKKTKAFVAFYGSKLFVKCFGWFILITLISTILISFYGYFYHFKPAKEEFESIASKILQNNGQLMVETYEKQGTLNFTKFRGPGNLWLYNENLELLFNGIQKDDFENRAFKRNEADKPDGFSPPPPPPPPMSDSEKRFDRFSKPDFEPRPRPDDSFNNNILASKPVPDSVFGKRPLPEDKFRPEPMPRPRPMENNRIRPVRFNTIDVKTPQNQLLKIKYQNFYKNNIDKVLSFARELLNKTGTNILKIEDECFFGCQLLSDNGKKYVAVIHIPKEMPEHNKYLFINQAKGVFPLIMLVCAILCFIMARYLAKPIIELQEASRKFAKGDFSQKITKETMNRYDEIGDLASDFNNMAERIESGINNQKRLFNDISHELRSPLARMQVGLELLQMKVKDSEKTLVERLEKDVNRMNALIGELLQFSKLENKEIGTAKEEISLEKSLEAVCSDAEFESNNNHKGVRLNIKKDSVIKGNLILIERAFENIIRNGLRFTPENTLVEVTLDQIGDKAVIQVVDHGPGIPESDIKKIFEPFYCVKPDRNPQNGGIGLGLPIALRAIQLHNGTIKIENRSEGGLLVSIELPLDNN